MREHSTKLTSALGALIALVATFIIGAAGQASAATVPVQWTNIQVTDPDGGSLADWEQAKISADWAVPAGATVAPGDTFSLAWESHLQPFATSFALRSNPKDANSPVVANCTVAQGGSGDGSGQVTCTFTDYVSAHPENLKGSLYVNAQQRDIAAGQPVTVTFTGGATAVPVTWTPEGGEPYNGNDYYKSGTLNPDGTITWTIQLAATADGLAQTLDNLVITDKLATPMELASAPVLFEATELSSSGQWPAYHEADASTYAVTTDPAGVVVGEMISGFTVNVPEAKQGHWYYVSFDTRVPADAPGGATYENTATTTADQQPEPAEASVTVTQVDAGGNGSGEKKINLSLTKSTPATTVRVGDVVTYTLVPHNDGPAEAITGWSVTEVTPEGMTLLTMAGAGYDCAVASATCTATGPLAAGADGGAVTVTARVDSIPSSGVLHNVAYVAPAPGEVPETNPLGTPPSTGTDTSTTPTDNDAQASVTPVPVTPPAVSVGDFVWLDSDHDGVQDAGEPGIAGATLTITGPSGAAVTDVNGKPVSTTVTDANGGYTFDNLPTLPAGQSYTVTVTTPEGYVPTVAGAGTPATDSSTGSASSGDLTADGARDATLDFGFVQPMNLVLAKTLTTSGDVHPGDIVTYELVPSNQGPGAALSGWSVTDVPPTGLTLVSMSGTGYTCDTASATCTAGADLASGASGAPITVTAKVDAGFTGTARNIAYVAPAPGDVPETNPLGTPPTGTTDTTKSPTDNDSEAPLTVIPAPSTPATGPTPPPSQTGGQTPPPAAPAGGPATPVTGPARATATPSLAHTGVDAPGQALAALVLLGGGALLTLAGGRRRKTQ